MEYREKDLLRIAKRINNSRRTYLLVDPLQAKHMPVSPSRALGMMARLGELVAARCPEARLVIGFAETATAIGAVVARAINGDCTYMHTTREAVRGAKGYVFFTEEHSHATEQKLVADRLERCFSQTDTVVLVDDEFATGKTLINMVGCLRARWPALAEKRVVAASVIDRMSREDQDRWRDAGIESVCLLKLPNVDYSSQVAPLAVEEAKPCPARENGADACSFVFTQRFPDPREGVVISEYFDLCGEKAALIGDRCDLRGRDVLVLGTEECMLPALLIGRALEDAGEVRSVSCHATTRSPIGISDAPGYPIASGFRLHSLYDPGRETFLYDLRPYDVAVIVSDAAGARDRGMRELSGLLKGLGCREILFLVEG